MKRAFQAALVLVMLATALSAVGQTQLSIFHFKVPWIDPWNEMAAKFQAENPGIRVSTEVVGGGADWRTALKTRFQANEGPDIFIIEGFSDYQLWKEYIAPMDGQPWVKDLLPIARQAGTFDGRLMAMPVNIEGYGFIYNKDLFAKAGIRETPRTFSQLKATAERLKAAGITPFASGYGTWWVISNHFTNIPFAQQPDPAAFIAGVNKGTIKIAESPVFRQWKNVFDLVLANCEPNPLTTDHAKQTSMFANGSVAMIQQGNWKEAAIYSAAPGMKMGFLPIAISDDPKVADRLAVGIPFMFVVNQKAPKARQDAAFRFLNWMVSTQTGQTYLTEKFLAIPAFGNIPAPNLKDLSRDILEYAKAGKTIPWVFSYWPDGAPQQFSDLGQRYVDGKVTFDQYLAQMQETWNKLKK